MYSLCRLPMAKKTQFSANCDIFGSSCTDPLLSMRANFGVLEQSLGIHLQATLYLNVFIVSATGGQESQFGQILTFWGLLYRPPFTDEGQFWCARAESRSTLTGRISYECVHCVGFRWPKKQFWANFDIFGSSCTDPVLPMRAKFGVHYTSSPF